MPSRLSIASASRSFRRSQSSFSLSAVASCGKTGMYAGVKLSTFVGSVQSGVGFGPALLAAWSEADQALLAGILNYWFLNRTLEKARGAV